MKDQILIRIDSDIKQKLTQFARHEGKSISDIVRDLIANYIKNHDISLYIEDLWERMGRKIKDKGYSKNDINTVIKKVRNNSK